MSYPIEAVAAVAANVQAPAASQAANAATPPDFGAWLEHGVGAVNQDVARADHAVQMLAVGQADSLPDVMIALDNAKMSLSLMLQVRDRLVQGYQEIERMQI